MSKRASARKTTRPEPPPRNFLKLLGPGLVTGASDDDPSGIATYSQAGAKYGHGMLWTMVLVFPFMAAIQQVSALIGRVTGRGIAGNVRQHYPAWILYPVVILLLIANIANLSADLSGMAAGAQILLGGSEHLYAVGFALGSVILQIKIPYSQYANYLKWLCLVLFAYVAACFVVHVDWGQTAYSTLVPKLDLTGDGLTMLIAILGTTISPYLFFWQASGEVEELNAKKRQRPLREAPEQAPHHLERIRWDTYAGMALSNIIAWAIMLTVASTLHRDGKTEVETAAQAAEALKPIAGPLGFFLFAMGIIGTGLLALPVLAGSAAYAVGEALHWPVGLERTAREAKGFYAVIALSTLVAVVLGFCHLDPMKALFWSAVINGVIAAPLMVLMMLLTSSRKIMGKFAVRGALQWLGWGSTVMMIAATVAFFVSLRQGH